MLLWQPVWDTPPRHAHWGTQIASWSGVERQSMSATHRLSSVPSLQRQNTGSGPVGGGGGQLLQRPSPWPVEPPVPPAQLPEQHWLFFLHGLPSLLQAWALTPRPLRARTPLAARAARPRSV